MKSFASPLRNVSCFSSFVVCQPEAVKHVETLLRSKSKGPVLTVADPTRDLGDLRRARPLLGVIQRRGRPGLAGRIETPSPLIRSPASASAAKLAPSRTSCIRTFGTVYDVGKRHGTAFLVMEYPEDETLEQHDRPANCAVRYRAAGATLESARASVSLSPNTDLAQRASRGHCRLTRRTTNQRRTVSSIHGLS
jgi:hypothetical protein